MPTVSGGFALGFSTGFNEVIPGSGIAIPVLSQYWLNDFNKKQEIYTTWNK